MHSIAHDAPYVPLKSPFLHGPLSLAISYLLLGCNALPCLCMSVGLFRRVNEQCTLLPAESGLYDLGQDIL